MCPKFLFPSKRYIEAHSKTAEAVWLSWDTGCWMVSGKKQAGRKTQHLTQTRRAPCSWRLGTRPGGHIVCLQRWVRARLPSHKLPFLGFGQEFSGKPSKTHEWGTGCSVGSVRKMTLTQGQGSGGGAAVMETRRRMLQRSSVMRARGWLQVRCGPCTYSLSAATIPSWLVFLS